MKPLTRSSPRQAGTRTKVLLLRPTEARRRSARAIQGRSRTPSRLAFGLTVTVGVVAGVWGLGFLGLSVGFAPLLGLPLLEWGPGVGLVTGMHMLAGVPEMIIQAGVGAPMWLIIGFVLVAVPAAGITAAGQQPTGVSLHPSIAMVFSWAGAAGAALNAVAITWWTASQTRGDLIVGLPADVDHAESWLDNLQTAAGLDVVAVIASALWVVLVMRLAIPAWLRALAASAGCVGLVVAAVAMSMSNGAATEFQKVRSVVTFREVPSEARLLVGFTPNHAVTLHLDHSAARIELHDARITMTVVGNRSIAEMMDQEKTGASLRSAPATQKP